MDKDLERFEKRAKLMDFLLPTQPVSKGPVNCFNCIFCYPYGLIEPYEAHCIKYAGNLYYTERESCRHYKQGPSASNTGFTH